MQLIRTASPEEMEKEHKARLKAYKRLGGLNLWWGMIIIGGLMLAYSIEVIYNQLNPVTSSPTPIIDHYSD